MEGTIMAKEVWMIWVTLLRRLVSEDGIVRCQEAGRECQEMVWGGDATGVAFDT